MPEAVLWYNENMTIYLSAHSAYCAEYHIVWIPKYRRRILNPGIAQYLTKLLPKIIRQMPGCIILEKNIRKDHVHLAMVIPPKYRVSEVIARIKQFTSSKLRKKFSWLRKVYWQEPVLWSPGYFVSTIGLNKEKILAYIKYQESQDSGQAKLAL